jgi:phosphoglycolate phosphatase
MNKPTLVFDLDGTLAHTAPDILGTLDHILVCEGLPALPHTEAIGLAGAGARALLKRAFAVSNMPLPEARLEKLFEDYLAHYETRIAERSHLFPGAKMALNTLSAEGHHLAVCTNKTERLAILLLEKLGVADRFKAICGRDSFAYQKPDARHLTSTIEKAGGLAHHAIMIGDTATDIATARNAKLPVIGVRFGYSDTPIDALMPDRLIDHFDELRAAVETLSFTAAR